MNCHYFGLELDPFKPVDKQTAFSHNPSFLHWLTGQYIIDGQVDIHHLFSWQGVFNLSAGNLKDAHHERALLLLCFHFIFYHCLFILRLLFDGIKEHPRTRKRLRKISQVRLAPFFLKLECSQNTDATEINVYRAEGEAHKSFSSLKRPIEENIQQ